MISIPSSLQYWVHTCKLTGIIYSDVFIVYRESVGAWEMVLRMIKHQVNFSSVLNWTVKGLLVLE